MPKGFLVFSARGNKIAVPARTDTINATRKHCWSLGLTGGRWHVRNPGLAVVERPGEGWRYRGKPSAVSKNSDLFNPPLRARDYHKKRRNGDVKNVQADMGSNGSVNFHGSGGREPCVSGILPNRSRV